MRIVARAAPFFVTPHSATISRRSSMRWSAWSSAASSTATRPAERSSIHVVISNACIGVQDNVLSTSGSSVPLSSGMRLPPSV